MTSTAADPFEDIHAWTSGTLTANTREDPRLGFCRLRPTRQETDRWPLDPLLKLRFEPLHQRAALLV